MAVNIQSKCWILALFIRDDGERLVLGDGAYDFKEKQQHFKANAIVNDTVDVQGNDGIMIAGQVRRASTQSFDGYIGDATVNQPEIEGLRRAFIGFFSKNHFYKVIYIMPDGTAVKRQRGFIVDAPEVQELWQIHPEYHVALNFEDVNYYNYNENEDGEEIYSQIVAIAKAGAAGGGLIWDEYGIVTDSHSTSVKTVSGTSISISDASSEALVSMEMNSDTEQNGTPTTSNPVAIQIVTGLQTITINSTAYSIDLGAESLCKLGTYKDYIYKDNGNWYIHKETGYVTLNGTENVARSATNISGYGRFSVVISDCALGLSIPVMSNRFVQADGTTYNYDGIGGRTDTGGVWLRDAAISALTATEMQSWLATNKPTVLYPLATATDTQITDATLIAELEAVANATLSSGSNTISVTSASNLASPLTIEYVAIEPGSSSGFQWEEGGGSAAVIAQNDSIDYIYPIINIPGPSVNPTIENSTTNQSISYTGTIGTGQTLIIDTTAQTALLNGLNVISGLSGDWLSLSPGDNRLTYTTNNSEAPNAIIEWSEVIG